ncbi:MAG: hypothetical protein WDN08_18625 [Rhizomicrobium sp.]
MIAARSFAHTDVGVFGLARTGLASIRALKAAAARVYAWDDAESQPPRGRRRRRHGPALRRLAVGQAPGAGALARRAAHSIPAPHDIVRTAKAHGVEVIGDMEIFAREIGADPPPFPAAPPSSRSPVPTASRPPPR